MIRNYFKTAWRSMVKNKTYSLLNIIGLSAGLTCFAFITLWVSDEFGHDRFNSNYDRIVRLTGIAKTEAGVTASAVSSAPMATVLKNDYAEVENTVRLDMNNEAIVQDKDKKILEKDILFTDPSFFDIFSFRLLQGDVTTALKEPYSLILTETTAKKYFGDRDPIGQVLTLYLYDSGANGASYTIRGVMPDAPKNSHFRFNILGSFSTVETANPDVLTVDGWGDASYYTYLLLKKGVDPEVFSARISQFYAKYIGERYSTWKSIYFYKLQPLKDIHLRSHLQYEIAPTGNISHVYIFSLVGVFILLLAGINYMNLSTARSMSRGKEVGIKKVVGALKKQLITQYIFEAVLTALIALAASFLFCYLLQPLFSRVTGKDISPFSSPGLVFFLAGVTVLLGVLSGIYPALVISGFKASSVLKGSFQSGSRGVLLRKSLVVTQFAITLALITGIIVINSQMSYIKHKDLGYNKDVLLFLRVHGNADVIKGYNAFKNELMSNPLIGGVSTSNSLPVAGLGTGGSETVDINARPLQVTTARLRVEADYLNVYGIQLIAGRDFEKKAGTDSVRPVILNEAAIKKFGWRDAATAIGKPFRMGGQPGIVTGVVKNFHFSSLQEAIEPLAIYTGGNNFSRITIKADMAKAGQSISWIEKTWKKYFPSGLLDYSFLDAQLGEQYLKEERFSRIFLFFSLLSLLIACLGLYGLISYAASQKTREIGIRKVLGASVSGIVMMLSGDFLKLVLVAFLISTPVAWYIMNNWLEDFAYRTSISWWMFGAAGLAVMLIALVTVSSRAIKAAIVNPVKSLRSE